MGALLSGEQWPPRLLSEWGRASRLLSGWSRAPRPPSGWGMAYRHCRGRLPRLRAVERTLSFGPDNGGNRIKLETLLGRWAGVATHEHDHLDDRMP
jgi:hypothetical protein